MLYSTRLYSIRAIQSSTELFVPTTKCDTNENVFCQIDISTEERACASISQGTDNHKHVSTSIAANV